MLVTLYTITAVLVLTGLQPLTIAGVFFGVCYLPGLTLFALIKKDGLMIEDLILAFPCSIGISSLLTLGILYSGIHVKFVAFIIYGITGLIILLYAGKHRKFPLMTVKLSSGETRFLVFAFLLTLIFSIPVISERIAISAHGFHHLSIVTRITNGIFPPENPGLGGTPISYHWGFHALVAALTFPSEFHPLRIFSAFNVISLFFIFCIAFRSAKSFGFSEGYCYLLPLAIIGLMRSDAGIFFLQNLYSGKVDIQADTITTPLKLLFNWVEGVSYIDTRLFFVNKFYNANNMPLGICVIFSFFLILLLFLEDKVQDINRRVYAVVLSGVLVALAITYAFFLIIILLFVPVWGIILFITNSEGYRDKIKEGLYLTVPCAIAAFISAPYIFVIMSGPSVVTAGKSFSEISYIYWDEQVIRNLVVFLLPSPLIISGFWFLLREKAFSRKALFLLTGTCICLMLSIFLRMQWYNEAKFSFILSFFFSFPFVLSVQRILSSLSGRWLKRGVVACVIVFLLASPIITEAAYICSPWFNDDTFAFNGRHVVFARDKSRNEAYTWIRENTPSESLLMLPYYSTPYWDRTAHYINYRPVVLSERSLFVINDVYTFILPEYEERVSIRDQFFKNPENSQVMKYFVSLNRPVYLLVEGEEDPTLEGVKFDQVPVIPGKVFLPVFQNERQRVYKIQYNK